jgi:hypothetical protein
MHLLPIRVRALFFDLNKTCAKISKKRVPHILEKKTGGEKFLATGRRVQSRNELHDTSVLAQGFISFFVQHEELDVLVD